MNARRQWTKIGEEGIRTDINKEGIQQKEEEMSGENSRNKRMVLSPTWIAIERILN